MVIAGAGPTGLMLAAELTLAGIDAVVVERRATQDLESSRSAVCTPGRSRCSISVASPTGSSRKDRRCRSRPSPASRWTSATSPPGIPTGSRCSRANSSAYWPPGWTSCGAPIIREREVTGFAQGADGVEVELSDGQSVQAQYLVGCDGGRSVVRKAAGIEFAGWDPTTSWLIAEVEMEQEPPFGLRPGGGIGRVADGGQAVGGSIGVVLTEPQLEHTGPPTLQDLSEALIAADGTDYGVHSPTWISRFNDMTRQAVVLPRGTRPPGRRRRPHPCPAGRAGPQHRRAGCREPGLEVGAGLRGDVAREPSWTPTAPSATRSGPACCRTRWRRSHCAAPTQRTEALQGTITELLSMDEPRRRFGGMLSGLDVHYDLGEGHPLLGPAHARCRSGHRRRTGTGLRVAAHGAAGTPQSQRTRRLRPVALGGPGPTGRRRARRHVGTPRPRGGGRSARRADPARRLRRMGRSTSPTSISRRP